MRNSIQPDGLCAVVISIALMLFASSASAQCLHHETQELLASDGESGDFFGHAVAIDGSRAIIGARYDSDAVPEHGAAYIFELEGGTWVEKAKLTAGDGASFDDFGSAVALSGNHAIVGAWADDDHGDESGSAYIFELEGGNWVEKAKLTAFDGAASDRFGDAVAVSGDWALVGASWDDAKGPYSGSAYMFRFDGSAWTLSAKLTASDGDADDGFSRSLALDADRAIIGAAGANVLGEARGAAYVFAYDGSAWVEESKLIASDGAFGDAFGVAVGIDAYRVVIGAPLANSVVNDTGVAYVFELVAGTWLEKAKLAAADGATSDEYGAAVAVSGDLVLIGAPAADAPLNLSGAAYVYQRDGATWIPRTKLAVTDPEFGHGLGRVLSLSGAHVLAGVGADDDQGTNAGSAYLFDVSPFDASWSNYGAGWPGTLGIPTLTAENAPLLGTTVRLDLENSSQASTFAMLLIGRGRASFPTRFDGRLLVGPFTPMSPRYFLRLSPGITVVGLPIPSDPILDGKTFTLQALEIDAGASKGISFTPGLELVLSGC